MTTRFRRNPAFLAGLLWIVAGVVWLTGEAITASAFPGYSYATNYISDLGIPDVGSFQGRSIDSPLHTVMNVTFILQGVFFAFAAVFAFRATQAGARRWFLALAAIHTVGIVLVGLIHGSQASVESGIAIFHVIGAALAIVGGNTAAIVAGASSRSIAPPAYRVASIVLGVLGIFCLIMLEVDSSSSTLNVLPDGVWERASVYTLIAWELMTGVLLATAARRAGTAPLAA